MGSCGGSVGEGAGSFENGLGDLLRDRLRFLADEAAHEVEGDGVLHVVREAEVGDGLRVVREVEVDGVGVRVVHRVGLVAVAFGLGDLRGNQAVDVPRVDAGNENLHQAYEHQVLVFAILARRPAPQLGIAQKTCLASVPYRRFRPAADDSRLMFHGATTCLVVPVATTTNGSNRILEFLPTRRFHFRHGHQCNQRCENCRMQRATLPIITETMVC